MAANLPGLAETLLGRAWVESDDSWRPAVRFWSADDQRLSAARLAGEGLTEDERKLDLPPVALVTLWPN
jgi:hypothetical protein